MDYDEVGLKELSLSELKEKAPKEWRRIHDEVYEQAQDEDGYYHSALSDFKSKSKVHFQIDHITSRAKGGLTEVDNLQLLTRWENAEKGVK